jgi:hypothetical protein
MEEKQALSRIVFLSVILYKVGHPNHPEEQPDKNRDPILNCEAPSR